MEPAESIVRLGFSRWYERQLIESHAYLVTGSSAARQALSVEADQGANAWFAVRCRKCGHEWTIS